MSFDKMDKVTEQSAGLTDLETLDTATLLSAMNELDCSVPFAVQKALSQISMLVEKTVQCLQQGGRIFYIGAGTSGRLAVTDASELPPTFGLAPDRVIAIIAGGDTAIRAAVEGAEDNPIQGWQDLQKHEISAQDIVIGISASGTAPYVIGALKNAQAARILTGCITCNTQSPLAQVADYPIEVIVGPEFITGSTRLKAGTAQKLVLNMISTVTMIRLGKVKGNLMIDMMLTNQKLIDRGTRYVAQATGLNYIAAKTLLLEHGSVRKAIETFLATQT